MKPIGNIARHLDLRKPVTQEAVQKALRLARAEQEGVTIRQAAKAGYGLALLNPTAIAKACADQFKRRIPVLPMFVKE
jgi:hypothetical protein